MKVFGKGYRESSDLEHDSDSSLARSGSQQVGFDSVQPHAVCIIPHTDGKCANKL